MFKNLPLGLTALMLLCLLQPVWAGPETVTIASGHWPPYTGKHLKGLGAANEIATKAFLAMGVEPEFVFKPWKRLEQDIEQGYETCSTAWLPTEERKGFAIFSEPIITTRNVVFYSKKNLGTYEYKGLEELAKFKMGGIGGYFYVPMFKKNGIEMEESHSLDSLVHKLYLGRIDAFVEDELVGWTMIRELYPNELHMFASTVAAVKESENCLMCSKASSDSEEILRTFNKGLRQIKESSVYDRVLRKYK